MSPEVQGDIIATDGDHKIDAAEQEVPLIRHMIRYDSEVSWNDYCMAQGKSMDDIRNILNGNDRGIGS